MSNHFNLNKNEPMVEYSNRGVQTELENTIDDSKLVELNSISCQTDSQPSSQVDASCCVDETDFEDNDLKHSNSYSSLEEIENSYLVELGTSFDKKIDAVGELISQDGEQSTNGVYYARVGDNETASGNAVVENQGVVHEEQLVK